MRVLLTNDDGAGAPGLADLAAALVDAGHHVGLVVPDDNRSGTSGALEPMPLGHAVEVRVDPIEASPAHEAWAAVGCTPSLCATLGLRGLLTPTPEIVVSGPNHGWNIGRDTWRSGTVWAALTAWGMGVPALAVSGAPLRRYAPADVDALARRSVEVLDDLAAQPEPQVWNLNFPETPAQRWGPPQWVTVAPHERLADCEVRPVAGGGVVQVRQDPARGVHGPPGSDAAELHAGAVTLSRLRPLDGGR